MTAAREIARALGGEVVGRNILLCPGPGHSPRDRSLQVTLAPDGVLVHSFAGDHWQDCRDYVRERLGLPRWKPGGEQDRRIPSREDSRIRPPHRRPDGQRATSAHR